MGVELHYIQLRHILKGEQQGIGDAMVAPDEKWQLHPLAQRL
jgi:hypothetical protein